MRVKIQHPGLPDGYEITLTGLNAVLLNNEDVDVSDEAIEQYELVTGKKFSEVLQGSVFTGVRPEPEPEPEQELPAQEQEQETVPPNDGVDE